MNQDEYLNMSEADRSRYDAQQMANALMNEKPLKQMLDINAEATIQMPLHLTHDLIQSVREDELTKCEDKDEMNKRIGWLICAYDAMVKTRINIKK